MKTKEILQLKFFRGYRFLTIVMSIVLINMCTAVSAEKNKNQLDDTTLINMKSILLEEPEEELKMETWMIDEFKIILHNQTVLFIDKLIEEELNIEPWMSDFKSTNYLTNLCAPDAEEELEIEDWMSNINFTREKENLELNIVLK